MNDARVRITIAMGAATLLLLSAGCMVGPKYRLPNSPVSPAFKEALPAGWTNSQPADGAAKGEWWAAYGDAGLDALELQVNLSNQNVLAADAQFRAAKAAIRVARAGLFPAVATSPQGTRSRAGEIYTIPVDLVYQVDIWGSIRHSVAANSAIAQASAADLGAVRLLYQAELATDYFQIQGLDARGKLLVETVTSYEKNVQLTQNRYDGGVASRGDVALAQTQLETARAQLVELAIPRAQYEHALAVLTGRPPSALSIAAMPDQSLPPAVPVGLPSGLLERRPDIAAAERQVAAANEQVGVATAALYPSLTLSAAGGSQTSAILDLLTWPSRFWSVGPQLAQTLFDAGRRRAQIKITQATYDATVANYRQTVLNGFLEVEDHLAELRILGQEAEVVGRAVTFAQQSLEISMDQYRGGLTNYLQVITAQTSALQDQMSAVDILTRRKVASVALIQALGGGWDASNVPSANALR